MTAGGPATGARSPRARARREYALGLALGAVGAALVLLAVRQGWARVLTPQPSPLPATSVPVRGQDLVPAAGALGLACLAGLAAVAATRRLARRLTGVLLAVFGLIMIVTIGIHVSASSVLSAARATAVAQGGSVTAGGGGVAPGTIPGATTPGITSAGHVTFAAFPWQVVALAGAAMVIAAGSLAAWRGARWPAMSSRYERPAGPAPRPTAAGEGPGPGAGTLWDALSRGTDPTEPPARPAQPTSHPNARP